MIHGCRPLRRGLAALALALALGVPVAQANQAELKQAGLVDVQALDPTIRLDIRYATANNFTGQPVYPAAVCWLRAETAERLLAVQADLKAEGLGLKVFDCYRPFSIQKKFWSLVPNEDYVAKPVEENGQPVLGSKHNRGAAVDLTLVDEGGRELEMPSGFDDFSDKANRACAACSDAARRNAARLEAAMRRHGFAPLPSEWWHFDGPGWEGFKLLDAPLN